MSLDKNYLVTALEITNDPEKLRPFFLVDEIDTIDDKLETEKDPEKIKELNIIKKYLNDRRKEVGSNKPIILE